MAYVFDAGCIFSGAGGTGAVPNVGNGLVGFDPFNFPLFSWIVVTVLRKEVATVLLRPLLTVVRIVWYVAVLMFVLHRAGVNISAMVAGLGIGGMAVALASQDTLKNLFGSLMILTDKPFIVGQRIVVNGFDGVVEEIGIRSTKLRLLNGHQTFNDIISRVEVENIGSRPYIRYLMKLTLPLETKPDKLEEAVRITKEILENHEGMHEEFPPRVYLNEVSGAGFKLMIIFWYHPADYWMYQAYCEAFNLRLARSFEAAGIRLRCRDKTSTCVRQSRRRRNQPPVIGGRNAIWSPSFNSVAWADS